MKTYIIQLEAYDDQVSVRDKMGWAKNGRVVIVWPEQASILNRRLDLLLIQRRSQELGSQLALVSRDREVFYQARQLGLPVFKDLRKAQDPHWRVPHRFRRRSALNPEETRQVKAELDRHRSPEKPTVEIHPLHPAVRLAAFLAGILAFLAMAASLTPSARLTLAPKMMVQDVLIDVRTNPMVRTVNLSGLVPSEEVTVQVEGRDTIAVSGKVRLPTNTAEGDAEFTNLTDREVSAPAGTVVRTSGDTPARFETLDGSQLPAGPGKTVLITIRCLSAGETGNIPAGTLVAVEGGLGTELAVANPEPITGGTDRVEPAPTELDFNLLVGKLEKSLEQTALSEIQSKLAAGDVYLPDSLELVQTLEETSSPKTGEPADELTLSRRMEFRARVIRFQAISELVKAVFDANLMQGFIATPDSLRIDLVRLPEKTDSGDFSLQLHATRNVVAVIDESRVIQLALGASAAQAEQRLQASLPLEQAPVIQIQPDWWPRLPILPFRFEIQNLNQPNLSQQKSNGS